MLSSPSSSSTAAAASASAGASHSHASSGSVNLADGTAANANGNNQIDDQANDRRIATVIDRVDFSADAAAARVYSLRW
jgi:hypothetical protein